MDTRISFFSPIMMKGHTLCPGSGMFGEWYFGFWSKNVYVIDAKSLRNTEGTPVVSSSYINTKDECLLRVVLTILILPVLYALFDKLAFRSNYPDFYVNPLPENWRQSGKNVCFTKYKVLEGDDLSDFDNIVPSSFNLCISSESPWLVPRFQVFKVSSEKQVVGRVEEGVLQDNGTVKFESFFADSPLQAINAFYDSIVLKLLGPERNVKKTSVPSGSEDEDFRFRRFSTALVFPVKSLSDNNNQI